jgi:hypothetical protein
MAMRSNLSVQVGTEEAAAFRRSIADFEKSTGHVVEVASTKIRDEMTLSPPEDDFDVVGYEFDVTASPQDVEGLRQKLQRDGFDPY